MGKGREKRCKHYNRYNLRLTRYRRRQRVEIPRIDMRRHTRFLPDNDNEGELVAVDHYELAVPRQRRHRQGAHPEQHQRAQVQQQQTQHQNVPRGGSVWSETEDKLLFKAVAHYKRYNNSSSLEWSTVFGYYSLLGGAAVDVRQLKVHWKKITGLKKCGHLNDCSFFNDPECSKDFDLVFDFEEASSSSRSSSNTATSGNMSQSSVRSPFVPVQGDLSPENRRFLEVLVANTLAINELVGFQMIDERQAAFAKERFANADQPLAMTQFSILTSVQRAEFITRAFNESHP